MADGDGVTYTVKELIGMLEKTLTNQIGKIDEHLAKIDGKLDGKAGIDLVRAIEGRMGESEKRLTDLEKRQYGQAELSKFQRLLLVGVAIPSLGSFITLVLFAIGHYHA